MEHAVEKRPEAELGAWVRSAFRLLSELPGVHRVGLALVEGGGRRLSFTAGDRDNSRGADWCEIDAYEDIPLNKTVRSGLLIAGSVEELALRYPEFVGRQKSSTKALAAVPLSAAGQVLGGFALFYEAPQPFDDPQLRELGRLGETLGAELRHGQRARTLASRSWSAEPAPAGALVTTFAVSPDVHDVPTARHVAYDELAAWGVDRDVRETAVLCLSELVTNAVIHTRAGCDVRLVLHEGILTMSVRDAGTSAAGRPGGSVEEPLAVHGRGLALVEALSVRWGSELDADGMTVWCELEVP